MFERKRLPIEQLARLRHGHISVIQLQSCLPRHIWESYFKFGFVRNPFDRFVSTCFFFLRKRPPLSWDATSFMKRAINQPGFRRRILMLPQRNLLADETGTVPMDFIGRFEDLQQSCDRIFARIGIPATHLERRNASAHDHYSRYYDDTLREAVSTFYRADLENFDYAFDSNQHV